MRKFKLFLVIFIASVACLACVTTKGVSEPRHFIAVESDLTETYRKVHKHNLTCPDGNTYSVKDYSVGAYSYYVDHVDGSVSVLPITCKLSKANPPESKYVVIVK